MSSPEQGASRQEQSNQQFLSESSVSGSQHLSLPSDNDISTSDVHQAGQIESFPLAKIPRPESQVHTPIFERRNSGKRNKEGEQEDIVLNYTTYLEESLSPLMTENKIDPRFSRPMSSSNPEIQRMIDEIYARSVSE